MPQAGVAPRQIDRTKLLLVEGKDEDNFFCAFLGHLGIEDVQVIDVGGNRNFANKFPALVRAPGFNTVTAYGIVRDAEHDADAMFQSVVGLLTQERQPHPAQRNTFTNGAPKVGVYILPGDLNQGMLEDLCMRTVAGNPVLECVDAFIGCLEGKVQLGNARQEGDPYFPNNISKARAKAFLAGNPRDLPSVGVAAVAGVWDYNHACLADLTAFLANLR